MISAKIIADSVNELGDRLTTFVLVFPRIVLAEFNTHRVFSRNSASSRAIPFEKMLKMVKENPFIPIKWMKEHKGMQGSDYFENNDIIKSENDLLQLWLLARDKAVESANQLSQYGLTKQVCNRILEPFMWHTVIVTSNDYENFFALRAHGAAEIHIQKLAYEMLDVYNSSTPNILSPGQWHIPFGDQFDDERIDKLMPEIQPASLNWYMEMMDAIKVKVATARCARVSYLNFEGKDDYEADVKLHDSLLTMGHFSPFEHCAKAMSKDEVYRSERIELIDGAYSKSQGWSGNLKGFIQYRKFIKNENRNDSRVINLTK